MEIHELNTFVGTLGANDYFATDNGNDTSKVSAQDMFAPLNARIDNIIAGPASSAEEVVDARLGADGVTYPSLGDAIRDQVDDLESSIINANMFASNIGAGKALVSAEFVRGTYLGNGNFDSSYQYRVATKGKVTFDASTEVTIESGFRIRAIRFNKSTGVVVAADAWTQGTFTFTDEWLYAINIARVTEDSSEVADITEFAEAVWYPTELNKNALQASGINITASNAAEVCGSDLNNLPLNKMFALAGGVTIANAPSRTGFVVALSQRYRTSAGAATTQIFVDENGTFYNRIYWNNAWTNWKQYGQSLPVKILALGDSICRGGRNNGKGFAGDIGFPFINMGVGNATITDVVSTYLDSIHKFPSADNIPNQLTAYYNATDSAIQTAFGISKFTPDVIIAEGGINDYWQGGTMGDVPTAPISSDAEASLLDRSTLMGSLQYLFYNMAKLYHKAQRFFLISHKTYNVSGAYYCPTTVRSGGYTQKEMHDAIVTCCDVYGVKVIDVYKESLIDTKFAEYRTTAQSWTDANADDYCDHDGIHPLAYGYIEGYVPFVKEALAIGTKK